MEAKGVGHGGLCLAAFCAGVAFALKGDGPRNSNITQHSDISEAMGAPTTTTRDVSGLTTGPMGSSSPSDTGNPTTITVPLQTGTGPPSFLSSLLCSCSSSPTAGPKATGHKSQPPPSVTFQKRSDNPLPQELSKTTPGLPAPPSEQPFQQPTDPTSAGSPLCSGVPVDD
ncbi:uncharacterized protein [Excalfactoria chinensis]|uniref:uncharacterized protein isoform X4 n=1 Tax=Excalfactoria chinensis TaxID=46218 RepID=UPI003B3BD26F